VYFSGHRKGDVAFFHPASRSLLVQDLLFNQPPKGEFNESVRRPRTKRLSGAA
jgi:glyoxylase-like metal-dependent hydrolase (beta-lactamase superfamily II)